MSKPQFGSDSQQYPTGTVNPVQFLYINSGKDKQHECGLRLQRTLHERVPGACSGTNCLAAIH